jgi:hypothetical protein
MGEITPRKGFLFSFHLRFCVIPLACILGLNIGSRLELSIWGSLEFANTGRDLSGDRTLERT